MFSRRASPDRRPNPIAVALSQLPETHELLDLTLGNPTLARLGEASDLALDALSSARPERYEPDPQGLLQARTALSSYLERRGQHVGFDHLLLTASTSEAYALLFKLLADPGDEILLPRPSYPLLDHLCRLEAVQGVDYRVGYDGRFHLDVGSLRQRITPRTRAIVVVNPNNPTGNYLKPEELEALQTLGLPVISDEVFFEYPARPGPQLSALAATDVPVFVLGGLSKLLGLPQVKLSWIALGGPPQLRAQSRERLSLIADTYLSVTTRTQLALEALLRLQPQLTAALAARLACNAECLEQSLAQCNAVSLLHREGGFYAILRVPEVIEEEQWVLRLLQQHQVLVHPGYFYDLEPGAHLVVSLLPEPQTFAAGIQRLRSLVANTVT